jgi:hypothetical protein
VRALLAVHGTMSEKFTKICDLRPSMKGVNCVFMVLEKGVTLTHTDSLTHIHQETETETERDSDIERERERESTADNQNSYRQACIRFCDENKRKPYTLTLDRSRCYCIDSPVTMGHTGTYHQPINQLTNARHLQRCNYQAHQCITEYL